MTKKIDTYAEEMGMTGEEFRGHLTEIGVCNKNGEPKKKYINDGTFSDNGQIKSSVRFGELVLEKQCAYSKSLGEIE